MKIKFSITDKGITLNYELDTETAPYYYINELCNKLRDAAEDLEAAKLKNPFVNLPVDTLTNIADSFIGKPNTPETKEELKEQLSEAILEANEDTEESTSDKTEPEKEPEETTPIADLEKIVKIIEDTEKAPEIYRNYTNKKRVFDKAGELIDRLMGAYDFIDANAEGYPNYYEPNNPEADYRRYIHKYFRELIADIEDPYRVKTHSEEFVFWQERVFKRADAFVEVRITRFIETGVTTVRVYVDDGDRGTVLAIKQIYQPESFFQILIDEARPLKEILDYCSFDLE